MDPTGKRKGNEGGGSDRNSLTRPEEFKLMTWLSTQWERCYKARMTIADLTAEAGTHLTFSVSKGNVSGCLKDLGIAWPRDLTAAALQKSKDMAEMTAEVVSLRQAMAGLLQRMDQAAIPMLERRVSEVETRCREVRGDLVRSAESLRIGIDDVAGAVKNEQQQRKLSESRLLAIEQAVAPFQVVPEKKGK